MEPPTSGLGRGERAPDFVLPLQDGTPTRFYARAGGTPAVLLFCPGDHTTHLLNFSTTLGQMSSIPLAIFAVLQGRPNAALQAPFPVFSDVQGKVKAAYRLGHTVASTCFVLSPNLQVLTTLPVQDLAATAQQVLSTLATDLPPIAPLEIHTQAPVLLIPRVLAPEICRTLIHVWETRGHVETGVEHSHNRQRQDSIDHSHKSRQDHIVSDQQLLRLLTTTVGRRILSEVHKAFAFQATRFEGFKIACYAAASGGFFHAHRDNLSPSTAHRRFALTLNLNDDYDGGHLRFPEYGPHLYRPKAGDAVVFACSHLHEVTHVTQGRRFTLLSFLFGDADVRAAVPEAATSSQPS
jgi:predicted 2-oxoglutarate/Fe(II)-dependent dioxygenase YbiX/peroxiredoxin